MLRCGSQQQLIVWVAADDAVEYDHICRLDTLPISGDVMKPPFCPVLEPCLAEKPGGFFVVCRRELEVHGPGGAPPQQLDLDLAHAAADLEHGRILDSAPNEEFDDPPGSVI